MKNPEKKKQRSFDQQVLEELLKGPLTTYQIREMGPFHPAGAISRLRKKYLISTTRTTVKDEQGISHHSVALYKLEGPNGGEK